MGERIEVTSSLVQMCPGWGLNLTAQSRQRTLRCLPLRVAAPFMALGGRFLPRAVAARSPGLLTAIPWLAPRWLEWPDRDRLSAHAKELSMSSPRAITPAVTFPSAHTYTQQAQPPIALALALQSKIACAGPGTPGCGWNNSPALASPFAGELRAPALSSPAPLEATVHLEHPRRENATVGISSAFSQPRMRSQISQTDVLSAAGAQVTGKQKVPGAGVEAGPMTPRLTNMAPSWGPPGSFIGFTPGTFPASFHRIMTTAAPGRRAKQVVLPHQSSPEETVDNPKMPSLPEHKQHGGRETVAPGPVPLQGLGLVMEVISQTMKREVAAAIKEREEEAQSLVPSRSNGLGMTTEEDVVSDNLVRLYMQKMRKLSEEERFRLGLLR